MNTQTSCNSSWLNEFKEISVEREFKRADIVCPQGDVLSTVSYILSGKASLICYSSNGAETYVGDLSEGQFIGVMGLFKSENDFFEIKAITDLVVLTAYNHKLFNLMRANEGLYEALATDLSHRLFGTMLNLVDVHTLSVKGRICAEILRLALPMGINPDCHIIRPSPVYVELARRLNSTRETVSRTVNDLQKKGILSREPGALVVLNRDRLQKALEHI